MPASMHAVTCTLSNPFGTLECALHPGTVLGMLHTVDYVLRSNSWMLDRKLTDLRHPFERAYDKTIWNILLGKSTSQIDHTDSRSHLS